ncbi:MAG: AraC family transcriptional regulator [Cupriavidus sp.]|nr:MAG: AraC family transcriptional regulator [Cupriavidus sp.]
MSTPDRSPATGWVSARHLQHMIARGEAAGVRVDELLKDAGLARDRLKDVDAVIPLSAIESILSVVAERYADPLMGLHMAHAIQPATFGAVGYILQTATSFADVLDVVTRYNGFLSNIGRTSVEFEPGSVHIRWECLAGSAPLRRQATEYVLGAFAVLSRLLLPEEKHLITAVHLAHARPDDAEIAGEYFNFFKCPVHFDKPVSALIVPASILKVRMRHGDAFMREVIERHAQTLLRQREQAASLPDQVRHLIGAMMIDGVPSKDEVAQQLGISSRSLHRKLEEMGTGYRELLDEVRLGLAQSALSEGNDTILQIAERLGFHSHQAFLRWFKQSTGKTPGEYRDGQKGAAT